MSLKKEQVLALIAILLGAYGVYAYMQGAVVLQGRLPNPTDLEVMPVAKAPLVETDAPVPTRRDLFTQPRETRPLPPRDLDFPPRSPASVAALPLPTGFDYRNLVRLAMDGGVAQGATVSETAAETPSEDETQDPTAVEGPLDPEQKREQAAKTYDRVWQVGMRNPLYGFVSVDGMNKFDAEKLTDFSDVVVRIRVYRVSRGQLGNETVFSGPNGNPIEKLALADNLRNEIERRRRAIPSGYSGVDEREVLIVDLLEWAKEDVSVYEDALEQAKEITKIAKGELRGLRWQQRVLQAMGDVQQELQLLMGMTGELRETSFRYESLGRLQARLGLRVDAEQNLRRAVELTPNDAGSLASLAEFLLDQERSGEAVAFADRAERHFGALQQNAEKSRVVRIIVSCRLAVGDVQGARDARSEVASTIAPPVLDGAIAYAAGEVERALGLFQGVGSAGIRARNEARLGAAACLLRLERWQEACDALLEVYRDAPLLRHRAASGMALLYQRIGNFEASLAWADRALEANPQDAYSLYLRGRAMRLNGQLDQSQEALSNALAHHDDFVHAIVEKSRVLGERAVIEFGAQSAQLALDAARYSDRAVQLAPLERAELYITQGLQHFAATDQRGARAAFMRAQNVAENDTDKLFARGALAVVDYALGRVDDAVAVLLRMGEDLGKDDPFKLWADDTRIAIDEHAKKEMLEDGFERGDLGNIWDIGYEGTLRPKIEDGKLVIRGKFPTGGRGLVSAKRNNAIQNGKNFLAVAIDMQLGSSHSRSGFAGLRIQAQQGSSSRNGFRADLGVRDGEPFFVIDDKEVERFKAADLGVGNFTRSGKHRLELRVLPQGKQAGNTFVLMVSWDGQVIHQRELKRLSGSTQTTLETILFVEGQAGAQCDVVFDDYVLERNKER